MRGWQLSPASRKLDLVVVAARYDSEGRLSLAQGYERRGEVWSDLRLFDRATLIEKLGAQRRVAVGTPTAVPGDFQELAPVRLQRRNGTVTLGSGALANDRDHLAAPLF
ncbi:MAG TPA: hypothetical protein VLD63_08050 [Anaerolineales bacterium]|nr:hypothetical protein [Anaerolineales bacterium]